MFTGIVQDVGEIRSMAEREAGVRLTIASERTASLLSPGDSVAVNGVCLTMEDASHGEFTVTAVGETLQRTTLGKIDTGARVNLERAATLETALGGHLVQGHVDGIGEVTGFDRVGKDVILALRVPREAKPLVVPKGSIAVDGTSLTIVEARDDGTVTMTIIPHTLEHTIAGGYRPGTEVNIEVDIIGKYVMHFMRNLRAGDG